MAVHALPKGEKRAGGLPGAVDGVAWTCVRGAGFAPWLAMLLTNLPFVLSLLLAFPVRYGDNGMGFLMALGELALAACVALAATRLAKR